MKTNISDVIKLLLILKASSLTLIFFSDINSCLLYSCFILPAIYYINVLAQHAQAVDVLGLNILNKKS